MSVRAKSLYTGVYVFFTDSHDTGFFFFTGATWFSHKNRLLGKLIFILRFFLMGT